ncbi:cysteine--tRNA ligase [Patescibacteria group bacterium]|nr:MAG: cysteine--tRNA ligase [Patescibacteria group bacterium]
MPLSLHNTLTGKKEPFVPLIPGKVSMYNCGPTVYQYAHIGNLRAYVFTDVLRRALNWNGYGVKQVMNITDVGHMVGDGDDGEDKVEKTAEKEKKTAQEIATFYTNAFLEDISTLNIDKSKIIFCKATDHIPEQISLIQTLEKKGFTYITSDGVYFDTARFKDYGKLGNIDLAGLEEGSRVETNPEKRNKTDFALWKFSPAGEKRQQEWPSPWGVGFPGWHIECSAMSMKYLGETFDIHTGGIDHIPVHHNNEIAQSESATGKMYVHYWLHNAFLNIDGHKISKSIGNTLYIRDLISLGISPVAYRYWLLTGHYRTMLNFTKDSVLGAQTALVKLIHHFIEWRQSPLGIENADYVKRFEDFVNDDLDTPKALALTWELVKDKKVSAGDKAATLLKFDSIFGFNLSTMSIPKTEAEEIPPEITLLAEEREKARQNKDWKLADAIRAEIESRGYEVKDTEKGFDLRAL